MGQELKLLIFGKVELFKIATLTPDRGRMGKRTVVELVQPP